jgi:cephalosporin-C deacetylase
MSLFDLPLEQLQQYLPEVREPDDLDAFWAATIAESRAQGSAPRERVIETPFTTLEVRDVTFDGFGGDPIKAWHIRPAGRPEPLPTIVEFIGYTGGRGLPHDRIAWASSGLAHLVMDSRGQGSPWAGGEVTPDPHGTGPSIPGFLTRGIESREGYYYRRLMTDAVRCVDAARELPGVDADRLVVAGTSQGGGLALAAAAWQRGLAGALVDVPFLCHFQRAIDLVDTAPYGEITAYLAQQRVVGERAMETLSYFDGANFAKRADAPALFSVGLQDRVCPPSTVYAAYNRYAGPKDMTVYPFNGHEGGGPLRWPVHVEFVRGLLGA